jgi:hypothetical protein
MTPTRKGSLHLKADPVEILAMLIHMKIPSIRSLWTARVHTCVASAVS